MSDLFRLFRYRQLKPVWEFSPEGLIWRILVASHNLIVGEVRNQSSKTTSYFCIDSLTGKPLWKNISYDEPWWIGIESVYNEKLILHGFTRPDMPEHRGIRIVDLKTGKLVWENKDFSFWFMNDYKLYAHKYIFEKRIGYEFDLETGTVLGEYADNLDHLHELRRNALENELKNPEDLLYPGLYIRGSVESEVENYIQGLMLGKTVVGSIEYLLHKNILVLSYYDREFSSGSSELQNTIHVYDMKQKRMLLNKIIAKGVQSPSPDTFVVKDDVLYLIENQKTLSALKPWKSL